MKILVNASLFSSGLVELVQDAAGTITTKIRSIPKEANAALILEGDHRLTDAEHQGFALLAVRELLQTMLNSCDRQIESGFASKIEIHDTGAKA